MRAVTDWLARVVMLVLAGLVTLSIIGSIAAIPSGSIGERLSFAERPPAPVEPAEEAQPETVPASEGEASEATETSGIAQTVVAADPAEPDPARWLEAITYALLALTGILALATLTLWRILVQLKRIAEGQTQ